MSDTRQFLVMSGLAALLYLSGCSTGNSAATSPVTTPTTPTAPAPPPTPNVIGGSWSAGALSSTGNLSTVLAQFQGTPNQLTGQLRVLGDPAFDSTTSFPATGSIDSTGKVALSGTQGQETFAIAGTASADATTLSGTYTAKGPIAESGNIAAVHPPNMTGTYTGTYSDNSGDSFSGSLALKAGSPVSGSFSIPITGTAQASSPGLTFCGPGANPGTTAQFQFSGTQVGSTLNGILNSGTDQWGEINGVLSADGTTLTGTMTITDPNVLCTGFSFNGTLASTAKPVPVPPLPGDVTFTIWNGGPDSGQVWMNGQYVTCPAPPKGVQGAANCGQIVLPAGTETVQISAVPNTGDYAFLGLPCSSGGSTVIATNLPFGCTWPLVAISDIGGITPGEKLQEEITANFNPAKIVAPPF
jgi:hypothetical protein